MAQSLTAHAAIVNDGSRKGCQRYRTDDSSPGKNRMGSLKFHDWGMVIVLIFLFFPLKRRDRVWRFPAMRIVIIF